MQGRQAQKESKSFDARSVPDHVDRAKASAPRTHLPMTFSPGGSDERHAWSLGQVTKSRVACAASLLRLQRQLGNRYVQRVVTLAHEVHREPAVAPDVESAIDRARGGGQALDPGARRQMEPAFGADFSDVRVHTGSESDALNRAVSAVAFTTGKDIFFSGAAYDPGTSRGQELLAHELTHVVQQSGAPAVQGKLTVGEPNDPAEQEADQMARAVMNLGAVSNSGSNGSSEEPVQRQCSCGKSTAGGGVCAECSKAADGLQTRLQDAVQRADLGTIRREVTKVLEDGDGFVTLDATAQLLGPKSQTVKFGKDSHEETFQAIGQSPTDTIHGTVGLNISARWSFVGHVPVPALPFPGPAPDVFSGKREGSGQLRVETAFRIPPLSQGSSDDTAVKFKQPRIFDQATTGTGAALDPQPQPVADADDIGLSVTASPRVTFTEQTAKQATTPVLPGSPTTQFQTADVEAFGSSFTIDLPVTKSIPPKTTYNCSRVNPDFTAPNAAFGPFVISSDEFVDSDGQRQKLHDWYFGLDPQVRQDLEQGKGLVRVTGKASTTGSKTFNLELAEKRAKRVNSIIADFAGPGAHLNSFALGAFGAQTGANKEDASERRVEVVASGQVAASIQGDPCSASPGQTTPTGPTGPVSGPAPPGVSAASAAVPSTASPAPTAVPSSAAEPAAAGALGSSANQTPAGSAIETAASQVPDRTSTGQTQPEDVASGGTTSPQTEEERAQPGSSA